MKQSTDADNIERASLLFSLAAGGLAPLAHRLIFGRWIQPEKSNTEQLTNTQRPEERR